MRALKFTKIDFIKTKEQMMFIPVYLLLVSVIMYRSTSGEGLRGINVITVFYYMIFITIVFSTTPFGTGQAKETGYLLLLPATTWERVFGRFLYGLALMGIAVVCGVMSAVGFQLMGQGYSEVDLPVCLIGFAIGILIMTAEYVFFYLFGENQGQSLLGIVRVFPGMCFFFVTANLSQKVLKNPDDVIPVMETIGNHLSLIGWGSAIGSIIILIGAVALCVRVTQKRDY